MNECFGYRCDKVQQRNYRLDNKEELQEKDRKTRKIMTFNRCLHPRSSVARLYMKQKEGGRGLHNWKERISWLHERKYIRKICWVTKGECDWAGRDKGGIHKKEKGWKKEDFVWRKVTRTICRENQEHCTQVYRNFKEWDFEERDRGNDICSGLCTKNQFNQSKDRQTNRFSQM